MRKDRERGSSVSPNDHLPMLVPEDVAMCPICDAPLVIEDIQDWSDLNGKVVIEPETTVNVNCTTGPDIDSADFNNWMNEHWSTPYIDWMPIQAKVREWLSYNVPTTWNQVKM